MNNRLTDLNSSIDTAITNKTDPGSVTPVAEGTQIKAVAAYANPDGYGVYKGFLTQSGTGAPTLVDLGTNTTGITFNTSRLGAGFYRLTPSAGTLVILKTPVKLGSTMAAGGSATTSFLGSPATAINVTTLNAGNASDDVLNNTFIEILIYP